MKKKEISVTLFSVRAAFVLSSLTKSTRIHLSSVCRCKIAVLKQIKVGVPLKSKATSQLKHDNISLLSCYNMQQKTTTTKKTNNNYLTGHIT